VNAPGLDAGAEASGRAARSGFGASTLAGFSLFSARPGFAAFVGGGAVSGAVRS
jgi:hypothetical protein